MSQPPKASAASSLSVRLLQELYSRSEAESYGLTSADFHQALEGCTKETPVADWWRNLHVEELALARGCAAGNDHAWEVFLTRYREKLFDAARHITREDSTARELADGIYAELYGTRTVDGRRVSKLAAYSGRGSLEGWLRMVLAQEWVNRYRKQKRMVSLEEQEDAGARFAAPEPAADTSVQPPVIAATDAALAQLSAEERYILAAYFLDERTLADVARTLSVHESTVSRKVERLTQKIRKMILEHLVRAGMSRRQAEESMEIDVRDLALDLRSRLSKEARGQGLPAPE